MVEGWQSGLGGLCLRGIHEWVQRRPSTGHHGMIDVCKFLHFVCFLFIMKDILCRLCLVTPYFDFEVEQHRVKSRFTYWRSNTSP